jgi:anti-anti-sigma regulatory factor
MAMPNPEEPRRSAGDVPRAREAEPHYDFTYVVIHDAAEGTFARLRGDLDLSAAPVLLLHLLDTLHLPLERLTLDLSEVRSVDAHGLAALRVARKRADARGIVLDLAAAPESVRRALHLVS